ncbi:hypothetical protein SAMN05216189_103738 [Pseudomonas delhiensis]|uniref:Phage protein Gp138 N-terminal domain-containing protein n=1 Tax=Pseudomonas delhiensis TaxID=366289 RepID=A0A239MYC0_9PSED|nr:hypothetical protein [Pseudomonas delhiensis]SDK40853.1 hypothetical protein SAMN05216189_103738 [Pseudomonas delhiensis]SNT47797.1 hypothetical protein SAMN06295949_13344 [Pseudomonas delhiensis]
MSPNGSQPLLGSSDKNSDINALEAVIRAFFSGRWMARPVKVISVTNAGGVSPIGYVSLLPLVQQIDGEGDVTPHATIYNAPYMRIQGGANAVILDPQAGDIGIAVFCDRDISAVKSSRSEAPPGSSRQNDPADAVYLGSIIAAAPAQYVRFNESGIELVSPTQVHIQAPAAVIDGNTTINGNLSVNGGTVKNDGVSIDKTHTHSGVASGSDTSGPPST